MVVIWGSRLYGKVDVVPGFFHVATRFGHIYYLPLIPMKSFVVLGQAGDEFTGVPIPLSFKSILLAWLRAALLLAAIVMTFAALVNLGERDQTLWMYSAAFAATAAVLFGIATWHRVATRASLHRACALGEAVGLNEEGMAELYKVYGEGAARGFAVTPAGRATPSPATAPRPVVPVAAPAAQPSRAARPATAPIPVEPMPGEEEQYGTPPARSPAAQPARPRQSAPDREPELGL